MFWRRKKAPAAPPQIGCFGKLPSTGDFIRLNAGGEELALFDRWLGGAIDMARRTMGPTFDASYQPAVGLFVYRGDPKGEDIPSRGMVGAWAASGDNAGRLYPMVVFGAYDYSQLAATGAALPIALWPLLTAAYDLATQGRTLPADAFVDRVSRISLPNLDDPDASSAGYRAWLTTQTMSSLWDAGFGTDASRFWVLQMIMESVVPFRGQELPKTGLALRLPVGAGNAYMAAVWMDVILRLSRWNRTIPNILWTPQQAALLHLGPPQVGTFREMIAPTGQAEFLADLCGPPTLEEAVSRRALGPQLDGLVARTDISLASFLDALTSA
ncbi:type VI secretion system-associated protein TagF [Chondromyces crocatus]|uniref:Type VI secretion protein n=1 Tax=Chondromyces crocatus TaxID=52 RepID=A0A0K1EE95_CHOCO|nr:type VI secretion system-associated protein TagF [Chondromyces crocatus]AKT38903.1 uncharacterized protein CMC5_030500 [Chondromyces crocatus]